MARERKRKRKSSAEASSAQTPASVRGGLEGGWYKPLSDEAVQQIHEASVEVLERVGIQVVESEAREIFRAGGARIDEAKDRVYISREMIDKALETAPNNVVLYGRDDPRHDIDLGGKRVYLGTGGAAVKVLDMDGHVRESQLKDVALIGQLCDALDNIHFYLRPCVARDLSNEDLDINTFYAAMANTTKHVTGNVFTRESLADIIEMAEMIAGGKEALRAKPTISFTSCWTVAPLRYAAETVEVLIDICRAGLPVFLSSAPQSGATSPAALAGSLVQINAEELSGLVFTQLVNPGCPIILGYVPSVSDLRSGNFVGGAPEFAMMNAAVCQLGHFYNLPVYNSSGLSDSKIPDAQAGYEKGITGLAVALAGANYVHHSAGFLESLLTIAYECYVMDDDFNGSIMRMVRGIEVTPETLSIDVIEEVCFGDGHYLGSQQSLNLMHSEYYYPHTQDRRTREDWEADGSLTMRDSAKLRVKEILKSHQPKRFDPALDDAIRERFNILLPYELAGREGVESRRSIRAE